MNKHNKSLIKASRLGGKQAGIISIVAIVIIAIVALAVTSLAVSTGALSRRQTSYSEANRALYCSEAVTNTVIARTNLATMFATCEPGQCVILGTNTCGACGDTGTTMSCQDAIHNPTLSCTGYARIGYKEATSDKNLTSTGDCGKASYSVKWDYTNPGPGGTCAGGGIAGIGGTCGGPGNYGLY